MPELKIRVELFAGSDNQVYHGLSAYHWLNEEGKLLNGKPLFTLAETSKDGSWMQFQRMYPKSRMKSDA